MYIKIENKLEFYSTIWFFKDYVYYSNCGEILSNMPIYVRVDIVLKSLDFYDHDDFEPKTSKTFKWLNIPLIYFYTYRKGLYMRIDKHTLVELSTNKTVCLNTIKCKKINKHIVLKSGDNLKIYKGDGCYILYYINQSAIIISKSGIESYSYCPNSILKGKKLYDKIVFKNEKNYKL